MKAEVLQGGKGLTVGCECGFKKTYATNTIAKRMAKVHMIKKHGAAPFVYVKKDGTPSEPSPKAAKPRKQQRAVNFCPCCGTNLRAIEVAISL